MLSRRRCVPAAAQRDACRACRCGTGWRSRTWRCRARGGARPSRTWRRRTRRACHPRRRAGRRLWLQVRGAPLCPAAVHDAHDAGSLPGPPPAGWTRGQAMRPSPALTSQPGLLGIPCSPGSLLALHAAGWPTQVLPGKVLSARDRLAAGRPPAPLKQLLPRTDPPTRSGPADHARAARQSSEPADVAAHADLRPGSQQDGGNLEGTQSDEDEHREGTDADRGAGQAWSTASHSQRRAIMEAKQAERRRGAPQAARPQLQCSELKSGQVGATREAALEQAGAALPGSARAGSVWRGGRQAAAAAARPVARRRQRTQAGPLRRGKRGEAQAQPGQGGAHGRHRGADADLPPAHAPRKPGPRAGPVPGGPAAQGRPLA